MTDDEKLKQMWRQTKAASLQQMIDALERAKTDDHTVIAMCLLVEINEEPDPERAIDSVTRLLHQFDTDEEAAHVMNQASVGLLVQIKQFGDQKALRGDDDKPLRLN